jgi:hypothetical protein
MNTVKLTRRGFLQWLLALIVAILPSLGFTPKPEKAFDVDEGGMIFDGHGLSFGKAVPPQPRTRRTYLPLVRKG